MQYKDLEPMARYNAILGLEIDATDEDEAREVLDSAREILGIPGIEAGNGYLLAMYME